LSRRTNHSSDDLRAALLDTAARLIAERGAEALSVAEVARRLRVSNSTPYRYFADRETLLAASAARTGRQLADAMRAAVAQIRDQPEDTSTCIEALAATAAAYVRFVAQHRAGFEFIFAEELTSLHHAELVQSRQEIMDILRSLAAAVAGDSASALRLVEQHIGAAHGLSALYLKGATGRQHRSLDIVAAEAAKITRTLAAAAAVAA